MSISRYSVARHWTARNAVRIYRCRHVSGRHVSGRHVSGRRVVGCAVVGVLLLAGCAPLRTDDVALLVSTGTTPPPPRRASLPPTTSLATRDDEIGAAIERLYQLRIACGRAPRTCAIDDLALPGSTYHGALVALMNFRARYELRTVLGYGSLRFRVESVTPLDDERVVVHTCSTDSLVVFDTTGATPGIIFDDSVVSMNTHWTLVRHEGVWKWSEERILERRMEAGLCDGF